MALSKADVSALFTGKKVKWLPTFKRVTARLSAVPGVQLIPSKTAFNIALSSDETAVLAQIKVTARGLSVSLCLAKSGLRSPRLKSKKRVLHGLTHEILISDASEIDGEFFSWLKLAKHRVRSTKS